MSDIRHDITARSPRPDRLTANNVSTPEGRSAFKASYVEGGALQLASGSSIFIELPNATGIKSFAVSNNQGAFATQTTSIIMQKALGTGIESKYVFTAMDIGTGVQSGGTEETVIQNATQVASRPDVNLSTPEGRTALFQALGPEGGIMAMQSGQSLTITFRALTGMNPVSSISMGVTPRGIFTSNVERYLQSATGETVLMNMPANEELYGQGEILSENILASFPGQKVDLRNATSMNTGFTSFLSTPEGATAARTESLPSFRLAATGNDGLSSVSLRPAAGGGVSVEYRGNVTDRNGVSRTVVSSASMDISKPVAASASGSNVEQAKTGFMTARFLAPSFDLSSNMLAADMGIDGLIKAAFPSMGGMSSLTVIDPDGSVSVVSKSFNGAAGVSFTPSQVADKAGNNGTARLDKPGLDIGALRSEARAFTAEIGSQEGLFGKGDTQNLQSFAESKEPDFRQKGIGFMIANALGTEKMEMGSGTESILKASASAPAEALDGSRWNIAYSPGTSNLVEAKSQVTEKAVQVQNGESALSVRSELGSFAMPMGMEISQMNATGPYRFRQGFRQYTYVIVTGHNGFELKGAIRSGRQR